MPVIAAAMGCRMSARERLWMVVFVLEPNVVPSIAVITFASEGSFINPSRVLYEGRSTYMPNIRRIRQSRRPHSIYTYGVYEQTEGCFTLSGYSR